MSSVSSTVTTHQSAPGFFLLAWGLFASVIGWGLVTNFRGFAEKFVESAHASSEWIRRVPPWKWRRRGTDEQELAGRLKLSRLIAIPFAVLGPIMVVAGVVQIARGHIAVPRGPALPVPFALAFIAFGVLAIAQYWRRGGFLRVAAQRRGWMCAAAIIVSLGTVSFGVFAAVGQTTFGIAGWLVGGLAAVPLIVASKPAPANPGAAESGRDA